MASAGARRSALVPVPWRWATAAARAHPVQHSVELAGVEQRAVAGQERGAAGSVGEGAHDAQGRRLGVATIVGLAQHLQTARPDPARKRA